MIPDIEYSHLNIFIAYQQLQSQKHWYLIKYTFENWVGTKAVEKTVLLQCMHNFSMLNGQNPLHIFM